MTNRPTDIPDKRIQMGELLVDPRVDEIWQALAKNHHHTNNADTLRKAFLRLLPATDMYWVAEPMAELVEAGARTVPPFALQPEDIPSPCGLLLFEKPITAVELEGEAISEMTGLLWGPFATPDGDQTGVICYALHSEFHFPAWVWSLPFGAIPRDGKNGAARTYFRAMQTAGLMMQQPLAIASELEPDRAARKRLRRAGQEPKPVRVIELRRPKTSGGTGDGIRDYRHQWIVRGHWRQQWYPKRQVHRPAWIAPHVKGPEGAPLIGGDKVYAWKR